jgi:(p)ppGpp synthase/HD superfamily hydrolase
MLVTQRTEQAAIMAKKAHAGQIDRDGKNHYEHCERVARRVTGTNVSNYETSANAVIAAYLHDTLEDTALTYGEIERDFGEEIATAVLALTHLDGDENYKEYVIRVGRNPIARVVKIADIQDNLGRKDAKSFYKHDLYLWALDYLQNINAL